MAYVPLNSIVAVQSNPSVLQALVTVTNFPSNPSISGTVTVSNFPVTQNVSGSVIAQISNFPTNPSISGTVAVSNFPTSQNVNGSVIAQVSNFPTNPSISGTVNIGNLPVTQNVSGSVVAFGFPVNQNISGSVVSFINGTVPVNTAGSVIAFQGGTRISSISGTVEINSIVGTYAEDAAHTSGDKGLFSLGVRNDTMASVTSADVDYSPLSVGPLGELLTANAPITKWVQGTASCVSGVTQPLIAAQGASIFTYVTAVQLVNTTATNAYVAFLNGAAGCVIGYAAAPANGGANYMMPNGLKTLANGAFHASINSLASVLISVEGFISKT